MTLHQLKPQVQADNGSHVLVWSKVLQTCIRREEGASDAGRAEFEMYGA